MDKLYEIEVEKIKIKYEKLIGLTEISDIVIQHITGCNRNIYDFLEQAKDKCVLYSWLDEVINQYNKEKMLTYFSTSNIYKFKNLTINMKQNSIFKLNKINEYTINACIIWFKDGHIALVKESAEEVKKLYEK